jgi:menaquinone-9 beta-reductase
MNTKYDLIVVGAGIAGLSLACLMAEQGKKVVLLEKEHLPYHKVCGEYVSGESYPFLEHFGLFKSLNLPIIDTVGVSSPKGAYVQRPLSHHSIGISRYQLDNFFKEKALELGVEIRENTKVLSHNYINEIYTCQLDNGATVNGKMLVVCVGKKSNLNPKVTNARQFVGIKYHVKLPFVNNLIELHNFNGGYCGISKIENDQTNVCYLLDNNVLKAHKGDIKTIEQEVLSKNPRLGQYLTEMQPLWDKPLVTSQVHFVPKEVVINHVLYAGDAAGMIPPLCGNGITMAMQSAVLLSGLLKDFFDGKLSQTQLENSYKHIHKHTFGLRLWAGRALQKPMTNPWASELLIRTLKPLPWLMDGVIKLTHGKVYF